MSVLARVLAAFAIVALAVLLGVLVHPLWLFILLLVLILVFV